MDEEFTIDKIDWKTYLIIFLTILIFITYFATSKITKDKIIKEIYDDERVSLLGYIDSKNKWQYILDYFGDKRALRIMHFKVGFTILFVFISLILLIKLFA